MAQRSTKAPIIEARREQMFPVLDATDIARLKRFGEARHWPAGSYVMKAGEVPPGLVLVLKGKIAVAQGGAFSPGTAIFEHGPGSFHGELAQLSDRPALVDSKAVSDVDGVVIPGRALRDVMVQEAELGERLMRALILRRVGLLESGESGPILIGVNMAPPTCGGGRIFSAATAIPIAAWMPPATIAPKHWCRAFRGGGERSSHRAVSRRAIVEESQ